MYSKPPADAWRAMIWLSMVLTSSGNGLWEWYMEEKEADPEVVPAPKVELSLDAHEDGGEEVDTWIASLTNSIEHAVNEKNGMEQVINEINCSRVDGIFDNPAFKTKLLAGLEGLNIAKKTKHLIEKDLISLVLWEAKDFSSRHDYCSTSDSTGAFITALPGGGVVEIKASLGSGCGYDGDDCSVTLHARLGGTHGIEIVDTKDRGGSTFFDGDGRKIVDPNEPIRLLENDEWHEICHFSPDSRQDRRRHRSEAYDNGFDTSELLVKLEELLCPEVVAGEAEEEEDTKQEKEEEKYRGEEDDDEDSNWETCSEDDGKEPKVYDRGKGHVLATFAIAWVVAVGSGDDDAKGLVDTVLGYSLEGRS